MGNKIHRYFLIPASSYGAHHLTVAPFFVIIIGNQYGVNNAWHPQAKRKQAAQQKRAHTAGS